MTTPTQPSKTPRTSIIKFRYEGEEPTLYWINPWSLKEEKIGSLLWPTHPIEYTKDIESLFEHLEFPSHKIEVVIYPQDSQEPKPLSEQFAIVCSICGKSKPLSQIRNEIQDGVVCKSCEPKTITQLETELNAAKGVIQNDCETEERLKKLAEPLFPSIKVHGDSNCVPNEADIVESLCELINAANSELAELRKDKEMLDWLETGLRELIIDCSLQQPDGGHEWFITRPHKEIIVQHANSLRTAITQAMEKGKS